VLATGHETPASTVQDGAFDEVLEMPSHSWWPPVTGFLLFCVFAMLVIKHYWIAAGFGALMLLGLFAWHSQMDDR
jgi:hypothetical protein